MFFVIPVEVGTKFNQNHFVRSFKTEYSVQLVVDDYDAFMANLDSIKLLVKGKEDKIHSVQIPDFDKSNMQSFEEAVSIVSAVEDDFMCEIDAIVVSAIPDGMMFIQELCDFYAMSTPIVIRASINPIKTLITIDHFRSIYSFFNLYLSYNATSDNSILDFWLNEDVLSSFQDYIGEFYVDKESAGCLCLNLDGCPTDLQKSYVLLS